MLNIAIYRHDGVQVSGIPDLLFNKNDLQDIIRDPASRDALIREFGEGVCIGILGEETVEGFIENEETVELPQDQSRKGDLSFYEKL